MLAERKISLNCFSNVSSVAKAKTLPSHVCEASFPRDGIRNLYIKRCPFGRHGGAGVSDADAFLPRG